MAKQKVVSLYASSILFFTVFNLLTGCNQVFHRSITNSTASVAPTLPSQMYIPATTTQTVTATPEPIQTRRPTATTAKTPTAALIYRTWEPTMERANARALAVDLLKTNRGCALPCWWGLTPGETPWSDAEAFLAPLVEVLLVEEIQGITYVDVVIPVPTDVFEYGFVEQNYVIENQIIESIEVHNTGDLPKFTFHQMLSDYGPPDEIWLRTFSTAFRGDLPIEIALFFSEQGILAVYSEFEAQIIGSNVTTCTLLKKSNPILSLWSTENKMSFEETIKRFNLYDREMPFLSLEEATGMEVKDFYELHSNPGANPCIETPTRLWPEQF